MAQGMDSDRLMFGVRSADMRRRCTSATAIRRAVPALEP